MAHQILLILVVWLINSNQIQAEHYRLQQQKMIDRLLKNYDYRVPPSESPVVVKANIYFRQIFPLPDGFEVDLALRQVWLDERLVDSDNHGKVVLHPSQKIWTPDTFFQNALDVKSHLIPSPQIMTNIHPEIGGVLLSQRLTIRLPCPGIMTRESLVGEGVPCRLDLASYAFTAVDIQYVWKETDPLQMNESLLTLDESLKDFKVKQTRSSTCNSNTTTGWYSCLRAELVMKRKPSTPN